MLGEMDRVDSSHVNLTDEATPWRVVSSKDPELDQHWKEI